VRWIILLGVIGVAAVFAVRAGRGPVTSGEGGERLFETDEGRRAAELKTQWAGALERSRERDAVATALVRGELTMAQAIDRFRALLRDDPAVLYGLHTSHPGVDEPFLPILQLAGIVDSHVPGDPIRKADIITRLNALVPRTLKPVVLASGGSSVDETTPPAIPTR
jgi:hypothetical protein